MSKLDAYLRSIEKFGATGALLTSNQAITLKFPTGDRNATQVTPHDLLVGMIREVASPAVLEMVDRQRPARFDYESQGFAYSIQVSPRPGAWQVAIEGAAPARPTPVPRAPTPPPVAAAAELVIERGQYDEPSGPVRATASGSAMLDELTRTARGARASDIYLGAGAQPLQRAGNEVTAIGGAIDGDTLSLEIGVVAPAAAREVWSEGGAAVFAYSDGAGRVRATLGRDHRGPTVALRLLPDEAPLERLGLDVGDWLERTGLIVIGGPSGAGKTVALSALVRALGAKRKRVIAIEDPIELVQQSPWISQREIGSHVASLGSAVAGALRENPDAIAIGAVTSAEAATATLDAAAAGHLVLTTISAASGSGAIERLLGFVPADRREPARALVQGSLLGTICPVISRSGRTYEVKRQA